ncbi:MAG: DNA primase [Burkholderiaceae bacterium]|nr:DNA primase [Burkholderiaceae bacterium]
MIPPGFVAELLSRVDIAEVVGRHVPLKKGGANLMGLCPFHGEKSPSFCVSPTRQTYHCFGCGAHGNAIGFLMQHTGASFPDAVADLAQQVGLTVPNDKRSNDERQQTANAKARQATLADVLARAADHYRRHLKADPRAIDYLKGRGLSGEIAARFGVGYAPDGWRSLASAFAHYDDPLLVESGLVVVQGENGADQKRYDRFRDRIMFPIRSVQGQTIGFGGRVLDRGEPKYLNSPETPLFVKGRELYGLFESRVGMRSRGYALVVEGYMDVVALAQSGFDNAVATLGTACSDEHVRKLFRFTDSVVFSFDGDAAGQRAAGRALEAALPHASELRTVRFLFLPPEHDPDSFVRTEGAHAFERFVAQAVPLSRQMVAVARAGCDLGTPEGRARFITQARPLWSALPEGALKRQMLTELTRLAGLPEGDLQGQWTAHPAAPPGAPYRQYPGRGPAPNRAYAATRRAPRRPEDRIVQLLLIQAAWWDRLTAEDHELLHALPAPHGALIAWLESDLMEHGARPWAALRAALGGHEQLQTVVAQWADEGDDSEADFADLRRLLDGRLLESLGAQQRALAEAVATDAAARETFQRLFERMRLLKQRLGPGAGPAQ